MRNIFLETLEIYEKFVKVFFYFLIKKTLVNNFIFNVDKLHGN